MIENMDSVFILGRTVDSIKDSGKMGSSMGQELSRIKMGVSLIVSGPMESVFKSNDFVISPI